MARSTELGLIGLTSIALVVGLVVGPSPSARADTTSDTISSTILGGALSAVVSAPTQMSPVILDGRSSHASIGRPAVWTITNGRGSSAAWSLSVSATDFISAPGTLDTVERTVAVKNLTITPGIVTAHTSEGADAAPTTEPVTVSGLPQALVWTSTLGKGTFTLTPEFSLSVPLNAYRSNFSGAIDGSVVNPFVSILTFTIA
ncbi:hypothetical protein [Cryobacterium gelidum]|uniref:WxL domain-containing protein n=1 Tax=Cryobacterium gelidum TaxID=1259164 RepID=A0A4R9AZR4_9MICO|nr:hypothetical protein [Cryobacterium gelidum]TFD72640.1 hypothetical protein E3T50_04750 [Cryobacterium gelidum]